ncbi:MAG TPA: translation initiation factor 2 [Actinoplanes sp.]|nr:translation initiation factor 2 [Actinoplanes sp.]
MSSSTGVPDDDAYWQRPESEPEAFRPPPAAPAPGPGPTYAGPPRAEPPPATWRPPVVPQPPPPRSMPEQDMDALDEEEGSAKTVTYGIGLVAAAIAVILMCLLCARAIY